MNTVAVAALASWNLDWRIIAILLLIAVVYVRGWIRGRRLLHDPRDARRLACFLGGLLLLFLAAESPLDTFDSLFLAAHMAQHLLLMMIAPALVLLGEPALPMLRGLPRAFVKEGLGPFLTWPLLRKVFHWITSPPLAWALFAVSTILWHLPHFYELALSSRTWHGAQHASFFWTGLLFWWPIVRPGPAHYSWPSWVGIPYLLLADLVNTAISAIFIFSGKLLYPSYAALHLSGVSPADDQTLAGAIMWVPGSIVYLVPAVMITMSLLSSPRRIASHYATRVKVRPRRTIGIRTLARWRPLGQISLLIVAVAVMADGFLGTQIAPLNLAGVLPWIHWRALTILGLILVGNVFCFACPFVFVRDRVRKVLIPRLRWPRVLRTKWLPAGLLVVYFWAYEAFSLWNSPWLTAAIVAGYFLSASVIDGFFRGASFCKYVCPIGQFNFVTSLVSPREVAVRQASVCNACRTHDCIKGNTSQRGCETYLFQPKKVGNFDCTFCLDCVKACPHDNVGLLQIAPVAATVDPYRSSIGRLSKRWDWAALTLVIVCAAFVNAAGMVSPVMMWEHMWHARLGSMPLAVGLFVLTGLLGVPLAILLAMKHATRYVYALVPVGAGMWAAHLMFHFLSYWGDTSPAATELLLLDAGLLGSLYLCWRVGKQLSHSAAWLTLCCLLYASGVWIVFQPMQMRGMMMN